MDCLDKYEVFVEEGLSLINMIETIISVVCNIMIDASCFLKKILIVKLELLYVVVYWILKYLNNLKLTDNLDINATTNCSSQSESKLYYSKRSLVAIQHYTYDTPDISDVPLCLNHAMQAKLKYPLVKV